MHSSQIIDNVKKYSQRDTVQASCLGKLEVNQEEEVAVFSICIADLMILYTTYASMFNVDVILFAIFPCSW